jgi:beta-lactamase regulating signal transducer with metallopeptidase domain
VTSADVVGNVVAFAVQLAVIVFSARVLEVALRVDDPRARLTYWQGVLVLAVVLPFVQPWRVAGSGAAPARLVSTLTVEVPSARPSLETTSPPPALALPVAPTPSPAAGLPWLSIVLVCLATGGAGAVLRLALAARALRRARRMSRRLPDDDGGAAELRVSRDVTSPVTFGWRRPVILLPEAFLALGPEERRSVLCHERVHVERRDWLVQLGEELLRVAFWYHPAFHWLLGRLRLAREQVVDAEVVRRLGARAPYLEALVRLAAAGRPLSLAPAAPLFTRSHLAERVDLLLKEESMSRTRILVSLGGSAAALAFCTMAAVATVPLHAAAAPPPAPPEVAAPAAPAAPAVEAEIAAPAVPEAPPVPAIAARRPIAAAPKAPPVPPARETDEAFFDVAVPAPAAVPVPPVFAYKAMPPAFLPALPAAAARAKRVEKDERAEKDERESLAEELAQVTEARQALEQARRELAAEAERIRAEAMKVAEEARARAEEAVAHIDQDAIRKSVEEAQRNVELMAKKMEAEAVQQQEVHRHAMEDAHRAMEKAREQAGAELTEGDQARAQAKRDHEIEALRAKLEAFRARLDETERLLHESRAALEAERKKNK